MRFETMDQQIRILTTGTLELAFTDQLHGPLTCIPTLLPTELTSTCMSYYLYLRTITLLTTRLSGKCNNDF